MKTKRKLTYPATTRGSRIAAQVRQQANKLTKLQRRSLMRKGMAIIRANSP